jgi:CelD/BcsL family acetyltransferase involved in cellulose biosynthesis
MSLSAAPLATPVPPTPPTLPVPPISPMPAVALATSSQPCVARVLPRSRELAMSVMVVPVSRLALLVDAWADLAAAATEPNPFHEPWMLLPALQHLRAGDVEVALIYGRELVPGRPPLLCGLVPFERRRSFHGLPVGMRTLWTYRHCYSGTLLLRAGFVRPALAALFDWLAKDGTTPLVELRNIAGEGEIHRELVHLIEQRALAAQVTDRFTRALLRRASDADTYLGCAMSGGRLKELRRLERRLADCGRVDLVTLESGADPGPWIEEFLQLEASGWKGTIGTAMGSTSGDRRYFEAVVRGAHGVGRLMMMALRLDGRAVAMRCAFRAQDGAVAFRIAYDERLARYSPGVLLEVQNIRRVHDTSGLLWMDSCAYWRHPMIDHVWNDRVSRQTVLIATGASRMAGTLVVSFPLMRWLRDAIRKGRPAFHPPGSRSELVARMEADR